MPVYHVQGIALKKHRYWLLGFNPYHKETIGLFETTSVKQAGVQHMKFLKYSYPPSDKWYGHKVTVFEVTSETLEGLTPHARTKLTIQKEKTGMYLVK